MKWGMLTPQNSDLVINGRLEDLVSRPLFRNLLQKKRCVLTFNGYYEWKVDGAKKIPYMFVPTSIASKTTKPDAADSSSDEEERKEETKTIAEGTNELDLPAYFKVACLYNHPFNNGQPRTSNAQAEEGYDNFRHNHFVVLTVEANPHIA